MFGPVGGAFIGRTKLSADKSNVSAIVRYSGVLPAVHLEDPNAGRCTRGLWVRVLVRIEIGDSAWEARKLRRKRNDALKTHARVNSESMSNLGTIGEADRVAPPAESMV